MHLVILLVVPRNIVCARFVPPQLERSNSDGGVVALAAPAHSAQRDSGAAPSVKPWCRLAHCEALVHHQSLAQCDTSACWAPDNNRKEAELQTPELQFEQQHLQR